MGRKIGSIALIYVGISLAWMILGGSVAHRTYRSDGRLSREVASLWGSPQEQLSPSLRFRWREVHVEKETIAPGSEDEQVVAREREVWLDEPVLLDASTVDVDLGLQQRKKGLLWFSTYTVDLDAAYAYTHADDREGVLVITYHFPASDATYDDFRFVVDGDPEFTPVEVEGRRLVSREVPVTPGQRVDFELDYRSRGLEAWHYGFGADVTRVKNFSMTVTTDFHAIDFPNGTLSPATMERNGEGWRLVWASQNLISGFKIGMEMPRRLNPGPLAWRMSYFAPVSLGFFFAWIFVITLFRDYRLHPVNYLFLGAAFFAFHLLFAYTVDHISVAVAFVLASAVSIVLVVSYLRLVVGLRFAAIEAGLSQLVYLVLFAYAHFFEGFTGLVVTIGSILTLFALMQLTGRIDWEARLRRLPPSAPVTEAP